MSSDRIRVRLAAPPAEGKANRALIRLIAGLAGIPAKKVMILSGQRSRRKTVLVRGLEVSEVLSRLKSVPSGRG
jgi:uncharacterized protein (TIGR00251 family)